MQEGEEELLEKGEPERTRERKDKWTRQHDRWRGREKIEEKKRERKVRT